jgi:hypothetical protein
MGKSQVIGMKGGVLVEFGLIEEARSVFLV